MTGMDGQVEPVVERGRLLAEDGVELAYTVWARPGQEVRRLLLVLHGIGFYSDPYEVVARGLERPGTLVAGLDFRGHGRSGGARGAPLGVGQTLRDVDRWVRHMSAAHPGAPVVLLGDSMAGPFAFLYAAKEAFPLAGLVLTAPAVLLSWRQVLHRETLRDVAGLVLPRRSGGVGLGGQRARLATRDPSFLEEYADDPYPLRGAGTAYLLAIAWAMLRVLLWPRPSLPCPLLVFHGGRDYVISPLGSRLLVWKTRAPAKELVVLPQAYHTLFWDPDAPQVWERLEGWLLGVTADERRPLRGAPRGDGV